VAIRIESPEGHDALTEFVMFQDRVYEYRSARWPALLPLQLPMLLGESPYARGRAMRPFVARDGGDIVARALVVADERYFRHWNERIGHIMMFEAIPGTREAVKLLMEAACEWLISRRTIAARAGFAFFEFPFAIDDYESLPPTSIRQNPSYYHALLKDAGFESEQGWVDYKIEVNPELVARYESALEAARRAGFEIVPLKDIPPERRVTQFTSVWNQAFRYHWGNSPNIEAEYAELIQFLGPMGVLDTSVIAYRGGEPIGVVMVNPEISSMAALKPGRALRDDEKLNFLGIGVLESARGRGVNLAMASYAYLELIRRGAKYLSYTLVLDDNWPSRRTAEKLGAQVCANYLTYRRNFRNR
jgi:GNAT superfamily N-acetyltransferase